jgi:hypothetical protein
MNAATKDPSAGGSIAVIVSGFQVRLVLGLLLERELIEGLTKGKLPVDCVLGDAIVGDIEKSLGSDHIYEGLGQFGVALGGAIFGQVYGWDYELG